MEKQASIGVANVNRRLKAVYGKEYGIHMEAGTGGGLRVILRFQPGETPGEELPDEEAGEEVEN